jgi:hypothetical protein
LVIAAGIAGLICFALGGYAFAGGLGVSRAMLAFNPLWLVVSVVNLIVGVQKAGYSLAEELPILVPVFAIPACVAVVVWWRTH